MQLDTSRWSGDGDFTRTLVDALAEIPEIALVRVEDAPASRAEAGYALLSNEIYVAFEPRPRQDRAGWRRVFSRRLPDEEPALTLADLSGVLAAREGVGPADYSDEGMIQYLRAERIVPPYQTRGYKLVELVRLYVVGTAPRR
jgi:hypothetical protein